MSCSRGEVILLPIPFTDLTSRKVRPAVVIGRGGFPGDLFVVPISSQLQQVDLLTQNIQELSQAAEAETRARKARPAKTTAEPAASSTP